MKFKLIIISATCVLSLVPPAHGTLLEAKKAAAKGVGLIGAGAKAMKGTVLKGAGGLLSAKGDALKKAAALVADIGKEIEEEKSAVVLYPTPEPHPQFPIHAVQIDPVLPEINIHTDMAGSILSQLPIRAVQIDRFSPRFPLRTIQLDSISPQFRTHAVQVESVDTQIHEQLKNKLAGVWSTLKTVMLDKKKAVRDLVHALKPPSVIKSPVVYKYVTAPRYYSVPIRKHIMV